MKNAKIYRKEWFNILDPKVLKTGVRIKSCLDCSDVLEVLDQDGGETGEYQWFEGVVHQSYWDSGEGAWIVEVKRDDMPPENGTWQINFDRNGHDWDNIDLVMIYIKEWDD